MNANTNTHTFSTNCQYVTCAFQLLNMSPEQRKLIQHINLSKQLNIRRSTQDNKNGGKIQDLDKKDFSLFCKAIAQCDGLMSLNLLDNTFEYNNMPEKHRIHDLCVSLSNCSFLEEMLVKLKTIEGRWLVYVVVRETKAGAFNSFCSNAALKPEIREIYRADLNKTIEENPNHLNFVTNKQLRILVEKALKGKLTKYDCALEELDNMMKYEMKMAYAELTAEKTHILKKCKTCHSSMDNDWWEETCEDCCITCAESGQSLFLGAKENHDMLCCSVCGIPAVEATN
jgi:hypothetical protein